jgi:hypothetical protein
MMTFVGNLNKRNRSTTIRTSITLSVAVSAALTWLIDQGYLIKDVLNQLLMVEKESLDEIIQQIATGRVDTDEKTIRRSVTVDRKDVSDLKKILISEGIERDVLFSEIIIFTRKQVERHEQEILENLDQVKEILSESIAYNQGVLSQIVELIGSGNKTFKRIYNIVSETEDAKQYLHGDLGFDDLELKLRTKRFNLDE